MKPHTHSLWTNFSTEQEVLHLVTLQALHSTADNYVATCGGRQEVPPSMKTLLTLSIRSPMATISLTLKNCPLFSLLSTITMDTKSRNKCLGISRLTTTAPTQRSSRPPPRPHRPESIFSIYQNHLAMSHHHLNSLLCKQNPHYLNLLIFRWRQHQADHSISSLRGSLQHQRMTFPQQALYHRYWMGKTEWCDRWLWYRVVETRCNRGVDIAQRYSGPSFKRPPSRYRTLD